MARVLKVYSEEADKLLCSQGFSLSHARTDLDKIHLYYLFSR